MGPVPPSRKFVEMEETNDKVERYIKLTRHNLDIVEDIMKDLSIEEKEKIIPMLKDTLKGLQEITFKWIFEY